MNKGDVLGHYEILERLGRGGMGEVYRATDRELRRQVALKILPAEVASDPERLARLEREARMLAAVSHPNIAAVHRLGEAELEGRGRVRYLDMELVTGATLKHRLASGPLSRSEALAIGVQIARSLEAAHEKGIVHRDLKPSNVIVGERGEAKVLDFGIAKALAIARAGEPGEESAQAGDGTDLPTLPLDLTAAGAIVGTGAYMSPEQARGRSVDRRTDIWAMGCLLFEMLTGRQAFQGATLADILAAVLERGPDWGALPADVPDSLRRLLSRCLQKDPERRLRDAGDLRLELEEELERCRAPAGRVAEETSRARAREASLAVLPFRDLSPGGDQEYFSDGMTEALITALSRIEGLKVAARTSSFAFKNKDRDVREIGRRLSVASVLEGSVMKAGERLRITAQLIGATDGFQLWSNTYDRQLADIFAVQDDISRAITEALRVELMGKDQPLVEAPTGDLEAYNLYLLGRYFWNRRTRHGIETAIRHFEQVIERDEGFARAYVGLSDAYCIAGFYDYRPPGETFPRARSAAQRALELDPALAAAHCSLGYVAFYFDWDWAAAEREFARAIELDPHYPVAHQWYGNLLTAMGRFEEAAREMIAGQRLDPLSLVNAAAVGWAHYHAGELERAFGAFDRALALDSTFYLTHLWRGWTLERDGRLEESIEAIERAVELSRRSANALASLARLHAVLGHREQALGLLGEFASEELYVPPYELAKVHLALGDLDRAFDLLAGAFEDRSHSLVFLQVDPQLTPHRMDSRFAQLVAKVGLPAV